MVVITTVTAQRAKRASQANGDTQKNAESPANKSRKPYKNRDSPAYKNAESPFMRGFACQTNGKARATHGQSTQNRQQPTKFRPQALFEPLLTLTHAKAAKRQHTRKLTYYRKGLKMKLKTTKYIIEFPENNMPSAIHDNYYTVKPCSAVPTSRRISIPSYYIRDCCVFTDIKRREAKRILDRFLDQFFI
jgi:hypothetical protein